MLIKWSILIKRNQQREYIVNLLIDWASFLIKKLGALEVQSRNDGFQKQSLTFGYPFLKKIQELQPKPNKPTNTHLLSPPLSLSEVIAPAT